MRTNMTIHFCSLLAGVALVSGSVLAGQEERNPVKPVDFAREILPLLSEKCFLCHGPDAKKKDALRLDSYAGATEDRGGYQAINPDAPAKSEVLVRIHDPADPMPPEDSDQRLSREERELIARWIRQGGKYVEHWAFVPPRKKTPATGASASGQSGVIDAFVAARLEEKGVTWAPPADRSTLARRAALVLTGLPPEPAQLAAFLADEGGGAYERLVDVLMAGPRYGEHQARYWLDAVRYGDTHGLHLDNRRGIYPYRDWVVKAFNENLPLNDFVTWQIAGDLLPDPSVAQRVATGFVRMNPSTSEGGVLAEEFQAKNNFDRTETLGTVLLGMSLNCARCHTHKYDPIPQTEYYRLLAFFNSTAERSLDGNAYSYGPVVRTPENQAAWKNWETLESARDAILARASAEIGLSAALRSAVAEHAGAGAGWQSRDWRLSKAVAVDGMAPPKMDWQPAKGLPGVSKDHLPKSDRAVWVSFTVDAPANQVLWLTFSGGPGSQILVDGVAPAAIDGGSKNRRLTGVLLELDGGGAPSAREDGGHRAGGHGDRGSPRKPMAGAGRCEGVGIVWQIGSIVDAGGPARAIRAVGIAPGGARLRRTHHPGGGCVHHQPRCPGPAETADHPHAAAG